MLKIGRSRDRLIFNMEIPIPGKDGLYIETGPWTPDVDRKLCKITDSNIDSEVNWRWPEGNFTRDILAIKY